MIILLWCWWSWGGSWSPLLVLLTSWWVIVIPLGSIKVDVGRGHSALVIYIYIYIYLRRAQRKLEVVVVCSEICGFLSQVYLISASRFLCLSVCLFVCLFSGGSWAFHPGDPSWRRTRRPTQRATWQPTRAKIILNYIQIGFQCHKKTVKLSLKRVLESSQRGPSSPARPFSHPEEDLKGITVPFWTTLDFKGVSKRFKISLFCKRVT